LVAGVPFSCAKCLKYEQENAPVQHDSGWPQRSFGSSGTAIACAEARDGASRLGDGEENRLTDAAIAL
jgi:hypothetical protein